jgi:hypothetical protein
MINKRMVPHIIMVSVLLVFGVVACATYTPFAILTVSYDRPATVNIGNSIKRIAVSGNNFDRSYVATGRFTLVDISTVNSIEKTDPSQLTYLVDAMFYADKIVSAWDGRVSQVNTEEFSFTPRKGDMQNFVLMRESKKELAKEMEPFEKLVTEENYKEALTGYEAIYERTGSETAGFNAALLYEVTGSLFAAIRLMEEIKPDPLKEQLVGRTEIEFRAEKELTRMRENQRIKQKDVGKPVNIGDSSSPVDPREVLTAKIMADMKGTVPSGSMLLFINGIQTGSEVLANYITESLVKKVRVNGYNTVELPENQLIELQKQTSVSDAQAKALGQGLGANAIALYAVSRSGETRNFTIRVLDIATDKIVYQFNQKL